MDETLERRLAAVERALTNGDHDLSGLADSTEIATRIENVEGHIDDLDDRIVELEAATQALRGYVGNVRSVNREVERRADAALAAVEREGFASRQHSDGQRELAQESSCPRCGARDVDNTVDDPTPNDSTAPDSSAETGSDTTASTTASDEAAVSARNAIAAATTDGGHSNVGTGDNRGPTGLLSRVRDRL